MKKVLLLAPMGSVHRRFNNSNIQALQECGYEVHLLANFSNGDGPETHNSAYVDDCKKKGIKIYSLPFHRGSLLKNIRLIRAIKDILKRENFQIVHAHTETGGILLRLCRDVKNNSKFCFTPHGMSFYKGSSIISQIIYKPIEKWICSGMDANLAMNREEMDNLVRWNNQTAKFVHGIGLNIKRMQNIPESCHDAIRESLGIPKHSIMVLSVGELNTNKNHSEVIKAISNLQTADKPFYVICGVGELKEDLKLLARNLGLENNVILAGYRSDIPEIVSSADIFVFPSFHEGLPVSVLEAMAGGLPVVVSAIRGNVDLVKNGHNGFLFDPNNHIEIAEKLNELILSRSLRESMGKLNRQLSEQYSFDVVKNELIQIYQS